MKAIQLSWIQQVTGGIFVTGDGQINEVIKKFSTDTRQIQTGDVFIPLRGERFDGHHFIEEAYRRGAIGCISEQMIQQIPKGKWLILVSDTKKALMDLAAAYRRLFSIPVVGITGSVGKTSTKDMVAAILSKQGSVLKTQGNYNNEIGLPLTVFELNSQHTVAVLEMGMSGFGEIHNLSRIANPTFGIITNIGVSHIEHLGSREGILKAKSELFDYLAEDGIAILNGDEPLLLSLQENLFCSVITFGKNSKNKYWAEEIGMEEKGMNLLIHTPSHSFQVTIPCVGEHWIYNVLPGVILGELFGLNPRQIQEGILNFVPSGMRMEKESTSYPVHIINDTYNASPDSMKAAINVLCRLSVPGRRIVILGDMFELGSYSEENHREIGRYVAQTDVDLLVFVGKAAKEMAIGAEQVGRESLYFTEREELQDAIPSFIEKEDTVLVKASRGMQLEKIVEKLKEVK